MFCAKTTKSGSRILILIIVKEIHSKKYCLLQKDNGIHTRVKAQLCAINYSQFH